MTLNRGAVLASLLALPLVLAGCDPSDPAAQIDIRPSFEVRFATNRISPAVVQLNVVTEEFINGQQRAARSIGSGAIIDAEGHVLTNFHVAGRAKRIDITLANQEHVKAKLIGSDHWTDLAVVQLDMDEVRSRKLTFQIATLGNSSDVTLGQPVMAVGTPYGLSRTVTAGIVSNTDRYFDQTNIDGYETGWFNNWIQTDAAINPGNSGGPLINLRGEVIGINTRGFSEANNLGFAIPIDTAKTVLKEILSHEKVERSYIGLQLQPLQDLEKHYGLEANRGVLVASIDKRSPAQVAGMQPEDILLAVDGAPVSARFPEQLAAARKKIADAPVGSTLELKVRRAVPSRPAPASSTAPATTASSQPDANGNVTIRVTTEKLESTVTEERGIATWGLSVRDVTRAYLRESNLPEIKGVLVTGIRAGSSAERAEMQRDDIILSLEQNGQVKTITSVESLEAAMKDWLKKDADVGVTVYRGRGEKLLVIKP